MDKFGFYYKKKHSIEKKMPVLGPNTVQMNANTNKWKDYLKRSPKKPFNIIRNIYNLDLMLVNDENLKDVLIFNEFTQVVEKARLLPWEVNFNKQLTDDDLGELKIIYQKICR